MSDKNMTLMIYALWSLAVISLFTGNPEITTGIVGIFGGAYGIDKYSQNKKQNIE